MLIDLGFHLRDRPPTSVDIPLAVISPETDAAHLGDVSWIEGRPVLAVEFLNERESDDAVAERVAEYRACGVPLVWLIDPRPGGRTVRVFRSGGEPESLTDRHTLTGDAELPGFSVPVRDLFR